MGGIVFRKREHSVVDIRIKHLFRIERAYVVGAEKRLAVVELIKEFHSSRRVVPAEEVVDIRSMLRVGYQRESLLEGFHVFFFHNRYHRDIVLILGHHRGITAENEFITVKCGADIAPGIAAVDVHLSVTGVLGGGTHHFVQHVKGPFVIPHKPIRIFKLIFFDKSLIEEKHVRSLVVGKKYVPAGKEQLVVYRKLLYGLLVPPFLIKTEIGILYGIQIGKRARYRKRGQRADACRHYIIIHVACHRIVSDLILHRSVRIDKNNRKLAVIKFFKNIVPLVDRVVHRVAGKLRRDILRLAECKFFTRCENTQFKSVHVTLAHMLFEHAALRAFGYFRNICRRCVGAVLSTAGNNQQNRHDAKQDTGKPFHV